ncbi:MAG: glycosyltransferase family 2 protein [Candidatus Eremiobacteraeota bacterium]|nr:glycosyltransferase family 2 protein [Candidatus Eremiobacteraeota bacterium]
MARVVAHLIVGAKQEPFLPAMLASIEPAVEHLFVNENSGLGARAPTLGALEASALFRSGRLTLAQTVFSGFSAARNECLKLDRRAGSDTWIAFIDADEVHDERIAIFARNLARLPERISFVDGYTWHFFKSFDWYLSIERRLMFFRWSREAHWEGDVHERLCGIEGARLALPYVYAHYGHVSPFAEDTRQGSQYASLGQFGNALPADIAREADVEGDFRRLNPHFAVRWRRLIRFTGEHPASARPIIAYEKLHLAEHFRRVDNAIAEHQTRGETLKNLFRRLNYAQRWRLRRPQAARYGMLRESAATSSNTA